MIDEVTGCDVAVIGGGIIGLAIAWRAAQEGLDAVVIDPDTARGATLVAAGMLAPVTEVHYGEEKLLALNLASANMYPGFVEELERSTGLPTGYSQAGTLSVAFDPGDRAQMDELRSFQASLGLESQPISSKDSKEMEPFLAPAISGALFVPGDRRVDPRALAGALLAAASSLGVRQVGSRVLSVVTSGGALNGVEVVEASTSRVISCHTAVLAAGSWSGEIKGLPPGSLPSIRPVKGQLLVARLPGGRPAPISNNLRATVEGRHVYLVPRDDGRVVIGATMEEAGFDTSVTAGAVSDLLAGARRVLPVTSEMEIVEVIAGLRPASPDNAPLIGETEVEGLLVATGHFRNGILLAPVTSAALRELLARRPPLDVARGFEPARFGAGRR